MNWVQDLAIDFLNSVFNSNIDNRQSIGSAVLVEFTLMIVACRRAQKQILPKKLYSMYDAKDNAMVLSAACFCHGTEAEVSMGFLTWMAVAQTYPNMPIGVNSWRRLEIGRFMIVIIIKRLTMALLHHKGKTETKKVLEGVEIFLQSKTPQAFLFSFHVDSIKSIFRMRTILNCCHRLSKIARMVMVLCGGLVFWAIMSNFLVCCTCHRNKC